MGTTVHRAGRGGSAGRTIAGLLGLGLLGTALLTGCGHGGDRADRAAPATPVAPAPAPAPQPAPKESDPAGHDPGGSGHTSGGTTDKTGGTTDRTDDETGAGAAREETVYAELVDAWWATPTGMGLSYDKLTLLTGQEAIDYQMKTLGEVLEGPTFQNQNPRLRDVVLWPRAIIHGNQQLGPHNGTQTARLTPDQLVERVQQYPRTLVTMVIRTVDDRPQVVRVDEIYVP